MTSIVLHEGDNRVALRRLIDQGVRVHSVVTDPPYHLDSITKRFGKESAAPAKFGSDGAFARSSRGFMGSQWDGADASGVKIAFDPEFWRLIHDILLPGGYVVAFSGSRTGHWQACAMEMAGFIMHPFLGWVFGQGFPKAHNAARAIDKALGVQGGRGAPKSAAHAGWIERGAMRGDGQDNNEGWQRPWMEDADKVAAAASEYLPGSAEAAQWDGWAYGGQALKPALEPIYVGQKPFSEKNGALNLLKHGVGAININGCRVGYASAEDQASAKPQGRATAKVGALAGKTQYAGCDDYAPDTLNPVDADQDICTTCFYRAADHQPRTEFAADNTKGRHPANLLHDGSDDVISLFPESSGSGAARKLKRGQKDREDGWGMDTGGASATELRNAGSGSAARFFNSFPLDADPIFYQGKATKADRAGSKHPTVKPVALMQWLVRLVTPAGGVTLDPFAGSGTTGEAARREGFDCILMEAEEQFIGDIRRRFGLPGPVADFDDFDALLEDDFSELL